MKLRVFLLLICFFILDNGYAEDAKTVERKIVDQVNRNMNETIRFLEEVVNINSGTMNHEGVQQVGEVFAKRFEKIGFETRWISMKEVNRAGHLFAERKGSRGKKLLLIGHLDTVFEKDEPFQKFERKDSHVRGQGVLDMKGGDAIILFALQSLEELGLLQDTSIIVAFTGDEEDAGDPIDISRRDLLEAAKRSDVALAFESAEGLDSGTIARRGVSEWTLKISGMQAHSSGIFKEETGMGAIYEAARILTAFQKELAGEEFLTFNPGLIVGGTEVTYDPETSRGTSLGKSNIVAKTAIVEGDLRCISNEQQERTREKMRKIVEQHLAKTSATIEFEDGYPGMPPTEGNKKLLTILDQVSRDLGYTAVHAFDPGARGAGDISFVANYVDCLDGLGTMGQGGHSPDEEIDLEALPILVQRAAVLIYRLTR